MLSPFDCYELCVQSPRHLATFLHALHAQRPTTLREDFCGSAALSRRWVRDGIAASEPRAALAVDLDPAAIDAARDLATRDAVAHSIRFRLADALDADVQPDDACDLVFVGNFSIGYLHSRDALVTYFRRSRQRLALANAGFGGGLFVCDTYGGASAFKLGGFTRRHPSRGREIIEYAWSHDAADPLTAMVENSISFRILVDDEVVHEYPRAFTYRWRLWSIAELREAMRDAGFARSAVYRDANVAPGQTPAPVADPRELGDDWIVLVAAWS
jgi:hypothetical protein